MRRIHVLGASGSGATTLGADIAARLAIPHVDSDDLFWLPTDPPFREPRPLPDRIALLQGRLPAHGAWVLSGSCSGWNQTVTPLFELIVYLRIDSALRMARLHARERARYGPRIEPGGDMATASQDFLAWAERYDTAGLEQRSRAAHETWLAAQSTPVLRLDSAEPLERLTQAVLMKITPTSEP